MKEHRNPQPGTEILGILTSSKCGTSKQKQFRSLSKLMALEHVVLPMAKNIAYKSKFQKIKEFQKYENTRRK